MKKYVWLILLVLWMGVIFYFSHQPGDVSGGQSGEILVKIGLLTEEDLALGTDKAQMLQFIIRKSAHMGVYFILSILGIFTFRSFKINNYYRLAWIMASIYAVTDEFHQSITPDRGPSVKDVFIDSTGAIIGIIVYMMINKRWRENYNDKKGYYTSSRIGN